MKWLSKTLIAVLVVSMVISMIGCSKNSSSSDNSNSAAVTTSVGTKPADEKEARDYGSVKSVTLGAGPAGGTSEVTGSGIWEILRKEINGVNISFYPTAGAASNVPLLESGELQMGVIDAINIYSAINGMKPYEKSYDNLAGFMSLYGMTMQWWVAADSDIYSVEDFASKTICLGVPGSSSFQTGQDLLELAGLTEDVINAAGGKIVNFAWSEATTQLQDGNIDVLFWVTSFPHPAIVNISVGKDFRLIEMPQEVLDKYNEYVGGVFNEFVGTANSYTWQKEDYHTMTNYTNLMVDKSLPDDLAYDMIKALCENIDSLKAVSSTLSGISFDTIGKGMVVDLHPGVKKYYDEKGISYDGN